MDTSEKKYFTILFFVIVSLFTIGGHDFKQSLEDAAQVTCIVGLQLICNTFMAPENHKHKGE